MNINDYRMAMDHVIPPDSLKARVMSQKTLEKQPFPVRRALAYALAAALTLTCLFTAALAASPELRTAVLSFFHMAEREEMPSPSEATGTPDISQAEIGALVKAQYINMDQYYGLSGDLLTDLSWSEDWRTLVDANFWAVRDNELVPAEVDLHTQQIDVAYNGVRYQGELYWYIRNGKLYPFKGIPVGADTQPEDQWLVRALSGRTDALLLIVSQGWQMEYTESTLLYHLDTGEVEDLFAGVDPDVLADSDGSIWSPGARRVLITGRAGPEFPNGREWLYDRESGTLTDVKELGGVGADYAVFVDDDTLSLRAYGGEAENGQETVACWAYDIPSGQAVQTLEQSPCYRWQDEDPYGVKLFYGGSGMEIGQNGTACLIDLVTGERTMLENFIYQENMDFFLNPAGNKLLYYAKDSEAEGIAIAQLGVIDLEKSTFIAFDREGYENFYEESISWADDRTVCIDATSSDGEARYKILYQF